MCAAACKWSEDNLYELIPFLHQETQVIGFCSKDIHPLSHLLSPEAFHEDYWQEQFLNIMKAYYGAEDIGHNRTLFFLAWARLWVCYSTVS